MRRPHGYLRWLRLASSAVGKGRLVPTILPRSLAGFVTDITITNDVTFDFNSSKRERKKEKRNYCHYRRMAWREPSALLFLLSCSCRPWSTRAASSRATPPSRSSGKTVSSQIQSNISGWQSTFHQQLNVKWQISLEKTSIALQF